VSTFDALCTVLEAHNSPDTLSEGNVSGLMRPTWCSNQLNIYEVCKNVLVVYSAKFVMIVHICVQ